MIPFFIVSSADLRGVSVGLDHLVDVDQRCTERASESMLTHRVHASTQISEGKTGPNQSLFFCCLPSYSAALAAVKFRVAEVLGNKMRRLTEKKQCGNCGKVL